MLNRLSFELAERQRYMPFTTFVAVLTHLYRLDLRKRELTLQKEELLKEGRKKTATIENVKTQIELLIKVRKHHGSLEL